MIQAKTKLKKFNYVPWLILAFPIIFTLWLKYYPICKVLYMSMFRYDPINPPGQFIGFDNFKNIFNMKAYWESWQNTFVFLLLNLALCFFVPLIQALMLNEIGEIQKSFTTLYVLPALVPSTVNVIIWKWIWHPDYGLANVIAKSLGMPPQTWLSDVNLVKFCIIFPGVLGGGLMVLIYLSAIQGISSEITEAARLDGCTGIKKIFHIILPSIRFTILIQLILSVINAMQLLDVPYMYASGGPSGASTTQGIFIYNSINKDLNYGRAAAASVILLVVVAVVTFAQMQLERRVDE